MEQLLSNFYQFIDTKHLLILAATISSYSLLSFILRKIKESGVQKKYNKIIKEHLQKREQEFKSILIPEPDISNELKQEILNASVPHLKQLLQTGKITSEQLLNLFASRAFTIGKELNYITEQNYKQALEDAKKCDQLRRKDPSKCTGELFGIVISVKDCFDLKGRTSSIGLASNLNRVQEDDGLTVKILKQAGAIVFVKSNTPQLAMTVETVNYIYGRGLNPWKKERVIGGSSGGEGALVASRCSPLGIGSDIGGSVRNPAAMNGVVGFKPTAERVSMKGHTYYSPGYNGQQLIKCSIGPLSKYVDGSALLMQALVNDNYHKTLPYTDRDMYLNNKPWDQQEFQSTRKLKIAYYKSIDIFPSPICVQRSVQEAVDVLKKNGHELVEVQFDFWKECGEIFLRVISSDKVQCFIEMLQGEKKIQFNDKIYTFVHLSSFVKNLLLKLLPLMGEKRASASVAWLTECDANEYRLIQDRIFQVRDKFIKYMQDNKFDAIVSPPHGIPAGTHEYSCDLLDTTQYASVFNILNVPAGCLPVTLVREDEQKYIENDGHQDMQTKLAHKQMQGTAGLPLNVQVAGYPMQEELVMNIMKQIETGIQFHKKHSYPEL